MSDKEAIAAFRATIECRIPELQAGIRDVENSKVFSYEYKAMQIAHLQNDIKIAENDLSGFDFLIRLITKTFA